MPIYEFACKKCGHKFEELCRRGEQEATCPTCQSKETSRLISAFGFAVKSSTGGSSFRSSSSGGACGGCTGGNCTSCH